MYAREHDEYTASHRGASGCVLWLIWLAWVVVTFAGSVLGESLGQAVARSLAPEIMESPRALSIAGYVSAGGSPHPFAALAAGLVAGLVLGIAQGVVLLWFLRAAGTLQWVGATTIGWAISWVVVYALSRTMLRLVFDKQIVGIAVLLTLLVGVGITAGMALGYAQGMVLRRRVYHPTWWVLATIAGPAIMALFVAVSLYVEVQNTLRDFSTTITSLVMGMSTGIALMEFLKYPTEEAEWTERLRWREEKTAPDH